VDLLEAADREAGGVGTDDRIGVAPPAEVAGQLVAELLGRLAAARATVQQLEHRMFGRGPASAARLALEHHHRQGRDRAPEALLDRLDHAQLVAGLGRHGDASDGELQGLAPQPRIERVCDALGGASGLGQPAGEGLQDAHFRRRPGCRSR
jgi:hypothetical protein